MPIKNSSEEIIGEMIMSNIWMLAISWEFFVTLKSWVIITYSTIFTIHYYQTYLLGVVQLLNKLDGTSFNRNDQNLFEVCFSLNPYQRKCYLQAHMSSKILKGFSDLSFSSCRDYCSNIWQCFVVIAGICNFLWHGNPQHSHVWECEQGHGQTESCIGG